MSDDNTKVVDLVKAEINKLGATSKENYEALQKRCNEFQEKFESQGDSDPITKEHLTKLSDDVTTRQDEIDKTVASATKRMDDIETAVKRQKPTGTVEGDKKLLEDYLLFEKSVASGKNRGLSWREKQELETNPKYDTLKQYQKAFTEFLYIDEKAVGAESYKALQVGVDVDGGYTVTPFMSNRISQRLFETDPIRQLASVETIGTDAYEMMMDIDEAGCEWEGETVSTNNAETPKMNRKRIPVHVLATRPRITQMLLDDSNINIEAWLSNKVADKFSRTESASFITGDGIGKPRGLGTYAAWTTAGTYEHAKIEQVASGHATQFTTDGLIDLKYSMIEQYLMRGTFLTNRLNVRDIMKLKDGDGQYIWRPGITEGQPAMLLGLPFRMSTTVATAAASALAMYLADFKASYLIVDRQGINVQRDPYTAKPFVEFYTRKRVGGDVINYQAIKIQKISA